MKIFCLSILLIYTFVGSGQTSKRTKTPADILYGPRLILALGMENLMDRFMSESSIPRFRIWRNSYRQ